MKIQLARLFDPQSLEYGARTIELFAHLGIAIRKAANVFDEPLPCFDTVEGRWRIDQGAGRFHVSLPNELHEPLVIAKYPPTFAIDDAAELIPIINGATLRQQYRDCMTVEGFRIVTMETTIAHGFPERFRNLNFRILNAALAEPDRATFRRIA